MIDNRHIILAFTGASGAPYGLRLLECLIRAEYKVDLVFSRAAHMVLAMESQERVPARPSEAGTVLCERYGCNDQQLRVYARDDWMAPIASGSHMARAMVVCPCSVGTLAAIATGMSDNLIERAADVMIKEQRQLMLVPREAPFSAIHLENMLKLARLGVSIMPANPGFYHQPQSIEDIVDFVVARILDLLRVEHDLSQRWGIDPEVSHPE